MKSKTSWPMKLTLALAGLLLLAYAWLRESHQVRSLTGLEERRFTGGEFIEAASYDGLMNRDGQLFDTSSLTPKVLQEKDCKT